MKNTRARKCLKLTLSVLVCLAVMATTCFAYRIDYAGGDTDFTLSGKTDEAVAGQIVTLKVENEGSVVYTRQTETNALGEYTFAFNVLEGLGGDLDITVNAGNAAEESTIYKSTTAEVDGAIAAVNGSGIAAALSQTVGSTTVDKILLVDALEVTAGGVLAAYVDANRSYANFAGFRTAYSNGLFLQELAKTTGDNAELYAMMTESGLANTLTVNAGEVFAGYEESEKIEVLVDMRGGRYTTDAAFKKALAEAVILNELSKVSTDNEKWSVLSNNNDYLLMDLTKYEGISKFVSLKKELFKNTITSISAMKTNAETIYSNLSRGGGGNQPSGGGDRENVSVSGGLVKPPVQPVTFGFSDLAGYDWAKDAILTLAADGIINGKSQGTFAPGDNVTRAEFAKIIVGAFDLVDGSATANFADTPKTHWSYSYVASAVANKIVTGVSANSFNPDGKITRQDMAAICYRALTALGVDTSAAGKKDFADAASISDYAKEAVDVLSGLGIINGKGNNQFAPNDFATRAEAAKIVHMLRALD